METRNIASSSKKLPKKPGLASRTPGGMPRYPPHPSRLEPLAPSSVGAGNVAPGQLSAADEIPTPDFVLEKRLTGRRAIPSARPLARIVPAPSPVMAAINGTPGRRSLSAEGSGGVSSSTSLGAEDKEDQRCGSLSLDDCWMQLQGLATTESNDAAFHDTMRHTDESGNEPSFLGPALLRESCNGFLQGDVVDEQLLQDWLGCRDLRRVTSAQLRVDVDRIIGVEQLRSLLPSLVSLRLNGSRIPTVRRLGTRYVNLKVLWLNNCRLGDVRGIGALGPNLRELYVAFNSISDLSPVLDVSETLEVLDVEGNKISDAPSLRFVLRSLTRVHALTLQGNPVEEHAEMARLVREEEDAASEGEPNENGDSSTPPSGEKDLDDIFGCENPLLLFRRWVQALMPWLKFLDDIPLLTSSNDRDGDAAPQAEASPSQASGQRSTTAARRTSTALDPGDSALREEMRFVQECIRDCGFDILQETAEQRNREVFSRASSSRGGNDGRPRSLRLGGSAYHSAVSDHTNSSMLTTGTVLSGSAIHSLRKRLVRPPTQGNSAPEPSAEQDETPRTTRSALSPAPTGLNPVPLSEEALLAWYEEDDEWERLKVSLMRDKLSETAQKTSQLQYRQRYEELKKSGLLKGGGGRPASSGAVPKQDVDSDGSTAAEEDREEESFDTFLKREVIRTRAQIARMGNAEATPGEAASDFVKNQSAFEVMDLRLDDL